MNDEKCINEVIKDAFHESIKIFNEIPSLSNYEEMIVTAVKWRTLKKIIDPSKRGPLQIKTNYGKVNPRNGNKYPSYYEWVYYYLFQKDLSEENKEFFSFLEFDLEQHGILLQKDVEQLLSLIKEGILPNKQNNPRILKSKYIPWKSLLLEKFIQDKKDLYERKSGENIINLIKNKKS